MVTISNNIKVGVSTPAFCDFWDKVQSYCAQLNGNHPNLQLDEYRLIKLNVYEKNGKLFEEYIISNVESNELFNITHVSNIKSRSGDWKKMFKISEQHESYKRKLEHSFDVQYFIKNN